MVECVSDRGEESILALIREWFDSDTVRPVGIGDDGAVIDKTWTSAMVLSADAMVEEVHFTRAFCPAVSVARKLTAVNVSDLAAMGARPEYALLTASFPATLEWSWVVEFIQGLSVAASTFQFSIAGGDVTGSPGPIYLSMSVIGECVAPKALERSTAQLGDYVYVTGALGAAAYGLHTLRHEPVHIEERPHSIQAYREAQARIDQGTVLARWGQCHAVIDISDGLSRDALRLATASGVCIELDVACVPIHSELSSQRRLFAERLALTGGEDYELLFTCSAKPPISAHCIGRVCDGSVGVAWVRNGQPISLPEDTFDHFGR